MTRFAKMSLSVVATVAIVATSLVLAQQSSTKEVQPTPALWHYDATNNRHWDANHGHWHDGLPPAGLGQSQICAITSEPEEAVTLAKTIGATVTGQNFCLGCALKKEFGAGAQCSIFGHKHSLRVIKATANGKELPDMQGWVLHYLQTQKSQDLIHKHHGENLSVTGTIYPAERVLEVTSFKVVAAPGVKAKKNTWHTSLPKALAEAQQRKTLILVNAYAEWCGWCKKLEKDTLSNPEVQARMQEFTLLKIDTDKQPQLARRFGVRGLPTTLILNPKGEVVLSQSGYMPPESYLKLLAKAVKQQVK